MKVNEERGKASLKLNIQKTKIMASGPITSWQIDGDKVETVSDFIFLGSKILWLITAAMKLKDICFLEESYDQPRQCIEKQRHHFADKGLYGQSYVFSSSHVHMRSVQFSRSVVSDSLQPHESQHARPPCPSPAPGVHSDSRPSSQ